MKVGDIYFYKPKIKIAKDNHRPSYIHPHSYDMIFDNMPVKITTIAGIHIYGTFTKLPPGLTGYNIEQRWSFHKDNLVNSMGRTDYISRLATNKPGSLAG